VLPLGFRVLDRDLGELDVTQLRHAKSEPQLISDNSPVTNVSHVRENVPKFLDRQPRWLLLAVVGEDKFRPGQLERVIVLKFPIPSCFLTVSTPPRRGKAGGELCFDPVMGFLNGLAVPDGVHEEAVKSP